MCHLMAQDGKFIHLHSGLVLPVDGLVANQKGSCDHVGGHAITDEEDNVFGFSLLCEVSYKPFGLGAAPVVIIERSSVLTRLIEGEAAKGFGSHVNN